MSNSEKYPRISIVIPSFNQGQFIGETLDSILSQNYPGTEIIVMDGGSTDNSAEVIKRFENHIFYWESEPDRGQTHAINKGFSRATGELFNWLNSDDLLEKNALHELAELSLTHPKHDLFIGRTRFFRNGETLQYSGKIVFQKPEITFGFGQINQPAMYYRLNTLQNIFPLNEELVMCMDLDLFLKYLVLRGQKHIAQTESVLISFRMHDASKTQRQSFMFREEMDMIYGKLFGISETEHATTGDAFYDRVITPETKKLIRLSRQYHFLWKADECLLNHKKEEARKALAEVNPLGLHISQLRMYAGLKRRLL